VAEGIIAKLRISQHWQLREAEGAKGAEQTVSQTNRRSASRPGANYSTTRRVSPIGDTLNMKQEGKELG
jgi:hypothetical protein